MKIGRIVVIGIIMLSIFCILSGKIYAEDKSFIEQMSGVDKFPTAPEEDGLGKLINNIIGVLQIAGTGISVITVSILGIKYILASVEQKAEIKKQAVPIVIGCILLFGAVNITAVVLDFATKTMGGTK